MKHAFSMYSCSVCDYKSPVKLGKCPSCNSFGTFILDESARSTKASKKRTGERLSVAKAPSVVVSRPLATKEFARVFPTGIRQGGMYLLAGEPGIGKSTVVLQLLADIHPSEQLRFGYFSWEETISQVQERWERVRGSSSLHIDIFHTTHLEDILATMEEQQYNGIIVDSIQMIESSASDSSAGTPAQVRVCSEKLSDACKQTNTTWRIIGHVTKGGEIAGPKYLEHIVDVVLYLEGDRRGQYRFLRCSKNRFGSTEEVGVFEMKEQWFVPVYNLAEHTLAQSAVSTPGTVLSVGLDTTRPVLITIEVLLNKSKFKFPLRNAQGIDSSRLNLIIAVVEKYLHLSIGYFDVYVNIPGEFSFRDNGLDLAVAAAIYSQFKNIPLDHKHVFVGELWLSGKVLKSRFHDKRTKEFSDFTFVDYQSLPDLGKLSSYIS